MFTGTDSNNTKVSGVQILTSQGSVLVGNNKYTKSLDLWLNDSFVFYDKQGKAQSLEIKKIKDKKASEPAWSINKDKSKLLKNNKTLYSPQEKVSQALLESNIKKLCAENISLSNKSCHWNFKHDLNILSVNNRFVCLQQNSLKELGGNKTLRQNKLINLDWRIGQETPLKSLFKHQELKDEILNQLYENLRLELANDINSNSVGESAEIEQKLKLLLKENNFKYSLDNLCVQVKTNAPYLIFGFPVLNNQSKDILVSKVLLTQDKLPKNIINLYRDFEFKQSENSLWRTMNSPDNKWSIAQNLDQVFVQNNITGKKLTLNIPANYTSQDEILGIFWIVKAPSLDSLGKNNYKKQNYEIEEPVKLGDLFNSFTKPE